MSFILTQWSLLFRDTLEYVHLQNLLWATCLLCSYQISFRKHYNLSIYFGLPIFSTNFTMSSYCAYSFSCIPYSHWISSRARIHQTFFACPNCRATSILHKEEPCRGPQWQKLSLIWWYTNHLSHSSLSPCGAFCKSQQE